MSQARFIGVEPVTRPTPERLTSTLLDHATVTDMPDGQGFGYRNHEGLWPSYNCLDLLTPTVLCPDPAPGSKIFTGAAWVPAFAFAVYGGVQCRAIGLDRADQEAEVARVFERSEAKGVERALRETRFQPNPGPNPGDPLDPMDSHWDATPDLTDGLTVPLTVALALLEGDAADKYAGLPTIHMPRAAATVLEGSGLIVFNGDKAYTKNGSKVAMGGGYDDPDMLITGAWTMYATGEVWVERSTKVSQTEVEIPGMYDGGGSDTNGIEENAILTLAERMYRVAVDCYTASATGRVWS